MDINLPCMNGIETVRRIRSLGIDTPVIAVTASSKNEDRIRQAETESIFDMILFKPFNSTSFYTAISPYVRSALLTAPAHTETAASRAWIPTYATYIPL